MIAIWLLPNKVKEFAETNCEKSGDRGAVGMVPVVSMHIVHSLHFASLHSHFYTLSLYDLFFYILLPCGSPPPIVAAFEASHLAPSCLELRPTSTLKT